MKIYKVVIAVLLMAGAMMANEDNLPNPVGFVNDFAGMLQPEEREQLEQKLQAYKQRTSIEFAVVTEDSLKGKSAFNRSLAFARGWGIGDKETGYGLLLYIVLKDRSYFLQISRHLEGNLTDGESGKIQRDNLVPHFRREEYMAGISSAVDAIIEKMGEAPMQERELLRQQKAEQEQQLRERLDREAEARWQRTKPILGYSAFVVFAGAVIFGALWRVRKRREAFRQAKSNTISWLNDASSYLKHAQNSEQEIRTRLDFLKAMDPKYKKGELEQQVEAHEKNLSELRTSLDKLKRKRATRRPEVFAISEEAEVLRKKCKALAALKGFIDEEIENLERAKAAAKSLFKSLSSEIKKINRSLSNPKVPADVPRRLANLETKLAKLKKRMSAATPDWISIYGEAQEMHYKAEDLMDDVNRALAPPRPKSSRSGTGSSSSKTSSGSSNRSTGYGGGYNSDPGYSSGSSGGFGGFGGFGGGGSGGTW